MADVTLEIGKTYPVLVDGAPAPTNLAWDSTVPGVINITTLDGAVVAQTEGTATGEVLSASGGGRSGSVTVDITAAPFVITFGDPL